MTTLFGAQPHPLTPWDRLVRFTHWSVALLFTVNYWALHPLFEGGESGHEWVGFSLTGLIGLRLAWGLFGPTEARLTGLAPRPSKIGQHLRDIRAGGLRNAMISSPGHNPIGAVMILFMWTILLATGLTGWLQTTDRYWGQPWVEDLHRLCSNTAFAAVIIHVSAVILIDRASGIPLIRRMIGCPGRPSNKGTSQC